MTKKHNERCRNCKETLHSLLAMFYDGVQVNYDIDFPSRIEDLTNTHIYSDLASIYRALQKHRGHFEFVKAKRLPRVDFYIPKEKVIIEFDESQHFTEPRGITLNLYPKTKQHGFSVDKWRNLCREMNKRDNDPPYRDEQRAWYDTIRDFAPVLWQTGKTIRLYSRDLQWCSLNPKNESDLETFKNLVLSGAQEI
jgi:hypothetical protein